MICDRILGKTDDAAFAGRKIDYVDVEWHEAFTKQEEMYLALHIHRVLESGRVKDESENIK